jgi:hypothetical protein
LFCICLENNHYNNKRYNILKMGGLCSGPGKGDKDDKTSPAIGGAKKPLGKVTITPLTPISQVNKSFSNKKSPMKLAKVPSNKLKLEYFPCHARGLQLRMLLHYLKNCKWEDCHITLD